MFKKTPKGKATDSPSDRETGLAIPSTDSWLTQDFDNIFNEMQRSFQDLMTPFFNWPSMSQQLETIRGPVVDIEDNKDNYRATIELPGYNKDQVDVRVNKNTLELKAEKKTENEQKDANYLHLERNYSTFQRTIALPEEVLPSKTESTMKNGILIITIPKKHPQRKESLQKVPVRG